MIPSTDDYRYERKYLINNLSEYEIENIVTLHPCVFSEIFYSRYINNIYLDSDNFDNYHDNVAGVGNRHKVRIRWYGDMFKENNRPVLEYKIKKGLLGRKDSYELKSFSVDKTFGVNTLKDVFERSSLPDSIRQDLSFLKPVLLNRYRRKYFISFDKKYRITLDKEMIFYLLNCHANHFQNYYIDRNQKILELKYAHGLDAGAKDISTLFPFRVTKSSKYVYGLECLCTF